MKQTIAQEPLKELTKGKTVTEPGRTVKTPGTIPFKQCPKSKFFVLQASLSFPTTARRSNLKAGFHVLSSKHESTAIYYQFANESVVSAAALERHRHGKRGRAPAAV
jgi:beta-fructofuranosidase